MSNGNFKTVYKEKSLIVELDSLRELADMKLIDFVLYNRYHIKSLSINEKTYNKFKQFFNSNLTYIQNPNI